MKPIPLHARPGVRSGPKGRQADEISLAEVRGVVGPDPEQGYRRDLLIEYLHALQDAFGGLFERHLVALAREMKLPMADVYGVATFYHHFDVREDDCTPAPLTIRVCSGLSCELANSGNLLTTLSAQWDASKVRAVSAPCVGRCEHAPVAVVHQRPVDQATAVEVARVVQTGAYTHGFSADRTSDVVPHPVGFDAYLAQGGYVLPTALANGSRNTHSVIAALEDAGLRGLGGAGFPTGRKWRIVREQDAPRLMAVNIDEGEPGTFKDRTYLERDPHRFLEGVLVAAHVVGIQAVYLYLRDEYHGCRALLTREIEQLRMRPPCPLPTIELRRGAGAYVCGEESAMIESIEGKRGEPRMRPPYIAQVGLFDRPTLEHNFETLYWVRDIVEKGAGWFTRHGRNGRQGLRSFSVSGRVRQPGVKLAPAGISVRQLIAEYCGGMPEGHTLYAYLPGGASGGILPASLGDLPLDFDTLQPYGAFIGSAAVIVLSHADRARDAALNAMRFFASESCGQCTPCRVGTDKAAQLMQAPVWDAATLEDICQVMADASICGLGQAAPNPVRNVLRYFPHEVNGGVR